MPELPEVETSRRGIEPYCLGQKIVQVIIRQQKLRWPIEANLSTLLSGKVVNAVTRRGKYLLLEFVNDALMIHLGMSGSLKILRKSEPAGKHDHVDVVFGNGCILRYNDPRRFGSFIYNTESTKHSLLAKLGPEPLTSEFDKNYLYSVCQSRKAPIKSVIMNSHVVVGVGNIYAQESLFLAGIHPNRSANKISMARIAVLAETIKKVLEIAIQAGGSSLKDFTSAQGKPGYFQHEFKVYGRAGESCVTCKRPLKHLALGQRTTTYCGFCQR